MKETKSSHAIFTERVFIVMEMMLSGLKRRDILQNVTKNENLKWDVKERQIDNYIKKADAEIEKIFEEDKEKLVKKAYARYDFLYKKLINVKDYKGAGTIIEKSITLTGIAKPIKVAQTDSEGNDKKEQSVNLSKLSTETLKALLNACE